jgi:hypothetical protein
MKTKKVRSKMIAGSIHSELRCLLRHMTCRLEVQYRLPKADLQVAEAFVNWVDDTPAARKALKSLGVTWLKSRRPTGNHEEVSV